MDEEREKILREILSRWEWYELTPLTIDEIVDEFSLTCKERLSK